MRAYGQGRTQGMQQIAAAVIGAAAAAGPLHREAAVADDSLDTDPEHRVEDAVRACYRALPLLDFDALNDLRSAVQDLERARAEAQPAACYCGTGREHQRGEGYHCRRAEAGESPR